MDFQERLRTAMNESKSLLCVGLDPQPSKTPPEKILSFTTEVIEATAEYVCAYKPQSAFYEVAGDVGWSALKQTVKVIREKAPHAVVILDAKRGDVPNTAEACADALFDWFEADAATINPYLGGDGVAPFLKRPDRGAFALCRTSNEESNDLQSLKMANGDPLYLTVAEMARGWGEDHYSNLGLVVGATWPAELAAVRSRCPDMPILLPGIGAQGGDLRASVRNGIDEHGMGLLVSSSRGITYAKDVAEAARTLRDAINAARSNGPEESVEDRLAASLTA